MQCRRLRGLAFFALVIASLWLGGGMASAAGTPETTVTDYDVAYDHASFWFTSDQSTATFRVISAQVCPGGGVRTYDLRRNRSR